MKTVNKPIDMIAHFSTDGNITLLRFRFTSESGVIEKVNPDKSATYLKSVLRIGGEKVQEFKTQYELYGIIRVAIIRYYQVQKKWVIHKME